MSTYHRCTARARRRFSAVKEIIRRTTDNTFLLWGLSNRTHRLLARAPTDFDIIVGKSFPTWDSARSFNLSNFGLDIDGFDILRLGPYTYGLMITQVEGENYIMVLRRHGWLEDVLYRIGIYQMPAGSVGWYKTRKWTVLRGDRRQKLEGMDWALPGSFGFDIVTDPTLPIGLIGVESGLENSSVISYEHTAAPVEHDSSSLFCEFIDPTRPAEARMICRIGSSRTLAIDLSFDFDSNPCALLYRDPNLRPVWTISDANKDSLFHRKTHSRHVWRISDCVQDLDTTVGEIGTQTWNQCNIITSWDNETGISSGFLRASSLQPTFARVPDSIISEDFQSPLFVALIPPNVQGLPRQEFWEFRVSRAVKGHFMSEELSERHT